MDINEYIAATWQKLTVTQTGDDHTLMGQPHPYVVPSTSLNGGFTYREQYYWDSYFIVRALLIGGQVELARGMVDNCLTMIDKYGFVPNANRMYMLSRSQPPLLSSMVMLLNEHDAVDLEWLKHAYTLLEQEYTNVWTASLHPHNRLVFEGLSRYYDINLIHALAEAESGWDKTSRFEGQCLDYVPVDLNVYLGLYERHLGELARIIGADDSPWQKALLRRKQTIKTYMWHHDNAWFYDFNYIEHRQSQVLAVSGLTPLLLGQDDMLSDQEVDRLVHTLEATLETNYGLKTTHIANDGFDTQWVAPNGWAPMHVLAVDALRACGRFDVAERLSNKWNQTVEYNYQQVGKILEKYNVVDVHLPPKEGHYPTQEGFAWTNASYIILQEYILKK